MSKNYLCKSIEINNFRNFESLSIDNLKRINIIGGFNGVGKSSLLETIFLLLDVQNSAALTKAYMWRQVPITSAADLQYIIRDKNNVAFIRSNTSIGVMEVGISKATVPQHIISSLTASIQKSVPQMSSAPSSDPNGLQLSAFLNNQEKIVSYSMFAMTGVGAMIDRMEPLPIPPSIIISANIKSSSEDHAQRLSEVVRNGRQASLIDPLKLIQPDLESFSILHNSTGPSIYASLNGNLIPINMLGDGFIALFGVILAISQSKNGVVLLDEVDASLHYSVTSAAWEVISQAANTENCQIFATSHSREGIVNAADGILKAGREKDFQYIRIEKSGSEHKAIPYSMSELKAAEEFNFEFR